MSSLMFGVKYQVTEEKLRASRRYENFKYITRSDSRDDINEYTNKGYCLDNLHSMNEHMIVNCLYYGVSWIHNEKGLCAYTKI